MVYERTKNTGSSTSSNPDAMSGVGGFADIAAQLLKFS